MRYARHSGEGRRGRAGRDAIDQKIGDYYGACMDENAAETKGIAPLKPELERIAAAKDKGALIDVDRARTAARAESAIQFLFLL